MKTFRNKQHMTHAIPFVIINLLFFCALSIAPAAADPIKDWPISTPEAGDVRVHRVVCALDCGVAIHPKNIAAQMPGGGIAFGLTAVLKGST